MRTLIWNVTTETQILPEIYESAEVATRWGYVVEDSLSDTVANLGGFAGMNNKWAIIPITPDEELGSKQVFGGGFAVALGSDGNIPWGNIVGKPVWAPVAYSGSYSALSGKPAISSVGLSGQYGDLIGKPETAAPSNASPNSVDAASSSAGTSPDTSRADHRHAHGSLPGGALHAAASATDAGFMTATQFTKLAGISEGAAALGSGTPSAVGAADAGFSTSAARQDHVHAHGDQAGGSLHAVASASAAGFMSAADKTKLDGVAAGAAALTSEQPQPGSVTAAVGTASTAARADHVHQHGTQGGGTQHSAASEYGAGFMSSADKVKLDRMSGHYDLMGYYAGETPDVGTTLLEVLLPRNITIEALMVSTDAEQIPLKMTVNHVEINPTASAPHNAPAGFTLRIVTTGNTGTKATFTVKSRET